MGCKLLRVHKDMLLGLMRLDGGVVSEGMPADAKLVGISDHVGFDQDEVVLKVESVEFPETVPGRHLDYFDVMFSRYDCLRDIATELTQARHDGRNCRVTKSDADALNPFRTIAVHIDPVADLPTVVETK